MMNNKFSYKKKCAILFIVSSLFFTIVTAQTREIDSLLGVLKIEKEDTNRVKTLNTLAFALHHINPDSTTLIAQQALALSEKIGWKKGEANSYRSAGIGSWAKGDYSKAQDYDIKSLKLCEELGDKLGQANNLGNLGLVYMDQGNLLEALDYYLKALKLDEYLGYKKGQASTLGNIGIVYHYQGDYPKALDYYLKALGMCEELNDKQGQETNLSNIGAIYDYQGDFYKALDYFLKALKICDELNDKEGRERNIGNIGSVYHDQGDYTKAQDYFIKALKICEELDDRQGEARNLGNIGIDYLIQKDYPRALKYNQMSLKIAEELGDKQQQADDLNSIGGVYIRSGKFKEAEMFLKKAIILDSTIGQQNELRLAEESISELYDTTQRYKLALYWFKKASVLKDTLFNADKNKAFTLKELTYQFDKKQVEEKAEQDKKDALVAADKKKQQIIIGFISGGFILVLASLALLFSRFKVTQKQKKIIERQKVLVEEKNKDILDSITYAKRLQEAILPPISVIKECLPDSFILYKPKDIVAGDFYWMERAADHILIAACDCTGHGVPGALVSVVCSNALNRAHNEFKIRDMGKMLDKTRELVLETFEKSEGGDVKDGMDISLCAINTKTGSVEWSGAYNPLWYTQNGELKEISSDKQPIGKVDNPKAFSTHSLQLKKGDAIYLFTDGYADQFGGPQGKKFKYKQLQQLLIDNEQLTMEQQAKVLNTTLETWRGNEEQVDDILVIGIRL
jgi:tetratricopeptide (TPR) repeat protein